MAWQTIQYRLSSVCPLLMHNGQTSDPLNKFAKDMKRISGKSKKTDADYEHLAKIEFFASLYLDGQGPVLPADAVYAALIAAAKKSKDGQKAQSGMIVDVHAPLEFDGPHDPEAMWADGTFRDTRSVRIQRNRVMRTRAIFNKWAATITVSYEPSVLNDAQIDDFVKVAGTLVGLCDYRPRYGRFDAERL